MDQSETLTVSTEQVIDACQAALASNGTPPEIAERVAASLADAEAAGRPSHGLLRLCDYVDEARTGHLHVTARPAVTAISEQVWLVDGQRGFGVLAADAVAASLGLLLARMPLCAVALVNAGHIGRLAGIGRAAAEQGGAVLGFVNYLGNGQRVQPWQGHDGRLCTNPLLIAIPGSPEPFVLDMSTSTVSEGAVRQRWLAGGSVPDGWLVDAHGRPVHDPARLYADPPTAFLTPLGDTRGHKGFGLGLAVELLAGVLTGAGFVQPGATRRGNGGLFLGLAPTLAGRTRYEVAADIEAVRKHVLASGPSVRWPGDRHRGTPARSIRVSRRTWAEVQRLANRGSQP